MRLLGITNEETGMEWQPIETAPTQGLVLITVIHESGERRTFAGELSFPTDDDPYWMVTHGWTGYTRLHSAWTPIAWKKLPPPSDA